MTYNKRVNLIVTGFILAFLSLPAIASDKNATKKQDKSTVPLDSLNKAATARLIKPAATENKEETARELAENKRRVMEQLLETMQSLALLMEQYEMMSQQQLKQVAMAMNQLSLNLHELSDKIEKSKLDKKTLGTIEKKTVSISESTEKMLLQFNDN